MRTPSKNNLAEPMIQVFLYRQSTSTTAPPEYCLSMYSDMLLPLVCAFLISDTQWEVSLDGTSVWIYRDKFKSLTCTTWDEWLRPAVPEPVGAAFPLVISRNDVGDLLCNNLFANPRTRTFQMPVQRSCVKCFATFEARCNALICELCVWFNDADMFELRDVVFL